MSLKGKEKAVDADSAELPVQEDDLDNFFVKKTKRRHLPKYSSVRSPSPVLILDESDDEDARARAKKAKAKKSSASTRMPEWTRSGSNADGKKRHRSAGRGSTEERKNGPNGSEIITLESSPEKESAKRREPELTPPPEMSDSKMAEIAQAVQSAVALKPAAQSTVPSPSKEDQDTLGRPSASAVDEVVKGYFRMVAPPERKESGESDKDIERYEKTRTITMGKTQPLSYAIGALASQIKKQPSDIVVTYNGDRVYSTILTPQSLGIEYDADFVCYEKAFYDRIELEAREKRRRADADAQREEEKAAAADAHASQSSEPVQEAESGKARLTLLGDFGQVSAVVQPHVTAANLCKYYLSRTHQDKSLYESYGLSLDGEILDPSTPFSEMDIEDGEQMDVVKL